ncbi:hypothetical protein [Xenorhabdus bharatensis]|uniref:hypothetical protein n=1 Tax=Xenorhabdus bharatensis TaxID=3136256 RepID=UPI0030F40DD7
MESFKTDIDIKKLVIAIVVMAVVFIAGYGFIEDKSKKDDIPTKEKILETYPIFEAINKLAPEKFEEFYEMIYSASNDPGKITKKEIELKAFSLTRAWFNNNIGRLLKISSDEAVNEFGKHTVNFISTTINSDPTGLYCFNMLYPGVIGTPDISRFNRDFKDFPFKRNYLNSIADSIEKNIEIDRLSVEQVLESISKINDKLVEKYGENYYVEDPRESAKKPSLECNTRLDTYKYILELEPHLSAEVIRYINAPE